MSSSRCMRSTANLAQLGSCRARRGGSAGVLVRHRSACGSEIENTPKLILLDLKLPRIDGHEVLKRIKGDPRTADHSGGRLTSSTEERDVMATYQKGANSYIVKPVDFEQFTESVRDIGKYWLVINHGQNG